MISSSSTSLLLRNQASKSIRAAAAKASSSSSLLVPQSHLRSFSSSNTTNKYSTRNDQQDSSNSIPSPQLTPITSSDPNALANYFHSSIHQNIHLPNRVALQAITHESWEMGSSLEGNNRRLAFIGRRALKFYLTLFLSSLIDSSPSTSTLNGKSTSTSQQEIESIEYLLSDQNRLDKLLHTTEVLGDRIGREWELEKVMRWRAALGQGRTGGKESGLYKIRGTCIEGVIGAIYHQQGALIASNVFHSKILPQLSKTCFPKNLSNSNHLQKEVERRRKEAERGLDSISSSQGIQEAMVRELEREEIKEDAAINEQVENEERLIDEIEQAKQIKRTSLRASSSPSSARSSSSSSIPPHQTTETRSVDSTSL